MLFDSNNVIREEVSAAFGAGAAADKDEKDTQDRRTTGRVPEITVQRPSLTSEPRVSDGSDAAFFAQQMRQREGSGSPRTTTIHKGTLLQRQNQAQARSDTIVTAAAYQNKRVSDTSDEARFQANLDKGREREHSGSPNAANRADTIMRKKQQRANDPRRSDTVTTDATVQNRHSHQIRYSDASEATRFGMKLMANQHRESTAARRQTRMSPDKNSNHLDFESELEVNLGASFFVERVGMAAADARKQTLMSGRTTIRVLKTITEEAPEPGRK